MPKLVLQQLDEHGEPFSGRVIVDDKMQAFDIDENGTVVRRVRLPE